MKRVLLFILFTVFIFPSNVFSQDPAANQRKYWYYRYRLKNDFMKVGKENGESLIANLRHTDFDRQVRGQYLEFGDQTVFLGMYIATLAMEYHLLATNNQNTDETVYELFHALYAINRLDMNAERFFRNMNSTVGHISTLSIQDLNGFFIRDDVDRNFLNRNYNLTHFNSSSVLNNGSISKLRSAWIETEDGYLSGSTSPHLGGGLEPSQDQVYYILLGMAMIDKFIPNWINYKGERFQDGKLNINDEARAIAWRVTSWMNHTSCPKSLKGSKPREWSAVNPVEKREIRVDQFPGFWSYATATITGNITGRYKVERSFSEKSANFDMHSSTLGPSAWIGSRSIFRSTPNSSDMAHMNGLLNALMGRPNSDVLYATRFNAYNVKHVPLIKQVLYGGTNPFVRTSFYENMLNTAPCGGPYVYDYSSGCC